MLLDVSAEAFAVDRAVENARSNQSVAARRAEEGQRTTVATRREGAQPFAPASRSAQRGNVGLDSDLVDEDQTLRIKARLS